MNTNLIWLLVLIVANSLTNIAAFSQGAMYVSSGKREALYYKCKYCAERRKNEIPKVQPDSVMTPTAPETEIINPKS